MARALPCLPPPALEAAVVSQFEPRGGEWFAKLLVSLIKSRHANRVESGCGLLLRDFNFSSVRL
jgi:hypothetical protein